MTRMVTIGGHGLRNFRQDDRYDTSPGELGARLSSGRRQRIAIARPS